jgi:endonuclease III
MAMAPLAEILEKLEALYGPQKPSWPTDPYLFLVWWHCGYPASDAACGKGWASLQSGIGVDPESLLAAPAAKLTAAIKPGGMVPEVRAQRLKQIAERVKIEFGGKLRTALKSMPLSKARAALKKFPSIANAGADRILLFGGIAPIAAVPSNTTQVLVRIRRGQECENYSRTYNEARNIIDSETPGSFDARARAYLLLKKHGEQICKRTNPKCDACPLRACAFLRVPRASALKSNAFET